MINEFKITQSISKSIGRTKAAKWLLMSITNWIVVLPVWLVMIVLKGIVVVLDFCTMSLYRLYLYIKEPFFIVIGNIPKPILFRNAIDKINTEMLIKMHGENFEEVINQKIAEKVEELVRGFVHGMPEDDDNE